MKNGDQSKTPQTLISLILCHNMLKAKMMMMMMMEDNEDYDNDDASDDDDDDDDTSVSLIRMHFGSF